MPRVKASKRELPTELKVPREQLATKAARMSAPGSGGIKREYGSESSDESSEDEKLTFKELENINKNLKSELRECRHVNEVLESQFLDVDDYNRSLKNQIEEWRDENRELKTHLKVSEEEKNICKNELKILKELKIEVDDLLFKTKSSNLTDLLKKLNYYAEKSKNLENKLNFVQACFPDHNFNDIYTNKLCS